MRRDEVLEHRQTFAESSLLIGRGISSPRRVRHQPTHTGDLANLHPVTASTGANHHLDRVGLHRLETSPPSAVSDNVRGVASRSPLRSWRRSPVGDQALRVLLLDLVQLRSRHAFARRLLPWLGGATTSDDRNRHARARRRPEETKCLQLPSRAGRQLRSWGATYELNRVDRCAHRHFFVHLGSLTNAKSAGSASS